MTLSRPVFEQLVALSSEGVLVADALTPDLRVIYVNPAYEQLTGYSAADLVGRGWPLFATPADGQPELSALKAAVGQAVPVETRLLDLRSDGTSWASEISIVPWYERPGQLKYFLCTQRPARDAAQLAPDLEVGLLRRELGRAQQKISTLSRVDPVTGLLKLDYFLELARRDFRMARRDRRVVAIMLFKLTEFDVYRQTFGDKAADSCLRMVGAQVQGVLRRNGDLCARHGYASVIAMAHGQDPAAADALAHRIAENVRGLGLHNPRAQASRYIGVDTAVAAAVSDGDEIEVLIDQARDQLGATEERATRRA
jgi:diguanylate cyclase (GGDEF)-like protein/PAS domain S-box-containing protein